MAAPVWLLTVDLQTKTASFTTGLADAAKKARSTFGDIGAGAEDMGNRTGHGLGSLRANLGLIDNTIRGAHAQAMADLIRMFSESSIVMAALPIAATAAGFALLGGIIFEVAEKVQGIRLAHEKLTDDMLRFGTTADEAYRGLTDKLLEAQRHSDELRNDHLGALKKQLELIDHQSMGELIKALDAVSKEADTVFKDLEGRWYTFWQGSSAGAKHSLDEFQARYDAMVASGNESGASDMLSRKLARETQVLKDQQTLAANGGRDDTDEAWAAKLRLEQAHADFAKKDIEAQQQLVDLLTRQAAAEKVIKATQDQDKKNAVRQTGNEEAQRRAEAARQAAQSMLQMGEQALMADKATADAALTVQRATLEQRLQSDIDFAGRERDIKIAANQAEVAALDKSGKDYANQLKALNEKALEIQQEYETKIATLKATESVAAYDRDLLNLEQSEREKIAATRQGTAARLQAIDAAIKEEQAKNLTLTEFYRSLLTERATEVRQEAQAEAEDREKAARENAASAEKLAETQLAADKEHAALADSLRHLSMEQQISEAQAFANREYAIKMAALQQEITGLDKSGKDYEQKLKQLQDKETQLTREHEAELTSIREKAEMSRNQRIMAARQQFDDTIASGLTRSIMGHQTWGQMILSLGDQVVSGMIKNAIMSMLADDMTKEKDAAAAARKAFNAGMHFPFPANLVAAPVLAAGAFATVMAFAAGTDMVPGVGRGDVVPAMLSPGEGVVPGGVMDGLRNVARSGGFDQKPSIVVHFRPVYHVQTIDGDGWQTALEKHADETQRHIENTLRKMNR